METPITCAPTLRSETAASGPGKIAVLIQASNNFNRSIILGASAYSREQGGWDFLYPTTSINGLHFPKGEVPLPEGWRGDGILFRSTSERLWSKIRESGIPAVNVSWKGLKYEPLISVVADPTKCGQMVADYLSAKNFDVFGYVGVPEWQGYPSELSDAINRRLGSDLLVFEFPSEKDYQSSLRNRLAEWLQCLPKPIGIVTWSTDQARILVSLCQSMGIAVPYEVSIVTCEYDELSAALSPISISGVLQNPHGVGFEAAKMLHRLMSGLPPSQSVQMIPPISVIERESSQVATVHDEFVQRCLNLIDQELSSGINVTDLASQLDVSRRTLEIKLSRDLDTSPSAMIDEAKLRKAKQLLSDTDLLLDDIAKRTGFRSTSAFTRFFKRNLGCPPSAFRTSPGSHDQAMPG
jgi:LacI family transcriptional regulator